MDEQLYWHNYDNWLAEHRIDTSLQAAETKIVEEMVEYLDNPSDDEALDMLNLAMRVCRARGIHNILHAGIMKLERSTTAKNHREAP